MNDGFVEFYDERLHERYYFKKHKSGLPIYVFPKDMTSSYALFGVGFGSFYNDLSFEDGSKMTFPSGVAHFLEHKLFSSEDGSDAFEQFASLGADANAYTSFNKTVYLFSCTENLIPSLKQLIDFVSHPYFTEENVKKEQGIIAQEIKMCDDNPYDVLFKNLLYAMYGVGRYSENICGSIESIKEITPEILYRCYELFYRYSNMALVVCGCADPDEVSEAVDEMLPEREELYKFRCGRIISSPSVFKPYVEHHMPVGRTVFEIGIKDVCISEDAQKRLKRDVAMTILEEMLFSRAGELYNSMLEEGLIGESYSYGYSITKEIAFHSVCGESDDPQKVLERIKSYIKKVSEDGLSAEDFYRCKRVFEAEFIRDFDSVDDIANSLIGFVFDGGEIFEYRRIIEGTTFGDVCKCFDEAFGDEAYFALSVVSEK